MFTTLDLESVAVATPELEAAVATFRRNFGLRVVRDSTGLDAASRTASLGVGPSRIDFVTPAAEGSPLAGLLAERGPGLYLLVLRVDDLAGAAAELSARGFEVTRKPAADGRPIVLLEPRQTHGARVALVEAAPAGR